MSLPDFKIPLLIEIGLARETTQKASSEMPDTSTGDKRRDLAAAFMHIGAEHVMSILHLFEMGAISSGYALLRPALETIYKSVWVATVAEAEQVEKAWQGKDVYGSFQKVISDIEKEHSNSGVGELFAKVDAYRPMLNGLTHSGAEQTLRRLKSKNMRNPEFEFNRLLSDIRTLPAALILGLAPLIAQERLDMLQAFLIEKHAWVKAAVKE
jgi:hypothetical protein